MDQRVQWLQHKKKNILQVDLRGAEREQFLQATEDFSRLLQETKDGSALVLLIVADLDFDPEALLKAKRAMLAAQPKLKRSALVGVDGVFKVFMDGFYSLLHFLGSDVPEDRGKHFKGIEEAKDWLAR